jgi:hypothetical protein
MGKSTISIAFFNSFLYVYQAGYSPRIFPQILSLLALPWDQEFWLAIFSKLIRPFLGFNSS